MHPDKDSLIARSVPDELEAWFPSWKGTEIVHVRQLIPLFSQSGQRRWREHPRSRKVDVVAINVTEYKDSDWCGTEVVFPQSDTLLALRVSFTAMVIGFPEGIGVRDKFPVWKSGTIASEPDFDFWGDPKILVDVRAISGMSGAPVFLRDYGEYISEKTGALVIGKGGTRFIGVYSGRVDVPVEDRATRSDIGVVWKPSVVLEILK